MDVEGSAVDLKHLLVKIEAEMKENIEATDVTERPLAGNSGGFNIQY